MKITITLEDDDNGEVRVEEVRHLAPNEQEVTAASVLAEEMLALLSEYGESETVLEASG